MIRVLFVGFGGFLGAVMRDASNRLFLRLFGSAFPAGTLFVNTLGCVLLAFIGTFTLCKTGLSENQRLFLTTGFIGALTTFSTFSYETVDLFLTSKYSAGALNIALNLVLGIAGVLAGILLGKYLNRVI